LDSNIQTFKHAAMFSEAENGERLRVALDYSVVLSKRLPFAKDYQNA
jgi:hypothetical protein